MTTAQNILKDLIGELKTLAKTDTIIGAPVAVGEFTVIPVSRVSLGVGAGGGSGEGDKKISSCEGGGGGGGVRVSPVAIVTVHGADIQVHMLSRTAPFARGAERVPNIIEKAFDRWQARKAKEEKKEES